MARLIIYTRVSSLSQESGTSPEMQFERLQQYCKAQAHEVVTHIHDTMSASGKIQRSGFKQALAMLSSGTADGLVVYKLDRFARNTIEGLLTLADLHKQGKQLVIHDLHVDTSTPMGMCIFTMLLAIAELERGMINERCGAGKQRVKELNGYVHGKPPYGWKSAKIDGKKTLVPDPEQQKWRAQIIEWRDCGLSYYSIMDELNKRGVPAQMGGQWCYPSVRQICKRKSLLIEWITNHENKSTTTYTA